ncbi:MAG: hypothetical protein H6923_09260 [Alphaproteobacteria bacterium]|nr:hypothetical protein [Alphaproteobacteria bacterium]
MPNYAHKKLVERIAEVDREPSDPAEFAEWIKAGQHLGFLHSNANDDEIVVYGSGRHFFAHSLVVPDDKLSPLDKADLLGWSCNPFTSIASTVYGGGRDDVWIERGDRHRGADTLADATDLVFARTFEGWPNDDERNYYEVHQEYAHLSGIHWRPEHRSYCRFDGNGDIEHVVSVTSRNGRTSDVSLVSFSWEQLETYLTITRSSLVRMFDFKLLRSGSFNGWPDGPETVFDKSDVLFWRQKVDGGHAAYTRGVQIIRPRRTPASVFSRIKGKDEEEERYAEFVAHDWRNKRVIKISTDPKATTNYFDAAEGLPFELSPAFFRPEVLLKYKADRDKYTVGEREVSCRAAWSLRGHDVNEAGQVHAYICDLRNLPYTEQLHWLSFNEDPKAGISKRAIVNDFEGKFADFSPPLRKIVATARRWSDRSVAWWTLRDEALLEHVNTPITASRDEWAESFMDLSKLVVEGFEVAAIRARLDAAAIPYQANDQSIALLEKLASAQQAEPVQFSGLRTAQRIRTRVKGHAGSSEARTLAQAAVAEHETFGAHFTQVCNVIVGELETIERLMT